MGQSVLCRRRFEPVADIGDVVLLLNGAEGPVTDSPFRQVAFIEGIQAIGMHGLVVIWNDTTVPAPYVLDSAGATGHLAAGVSTQKISPAALQFPNTDLDGLYQARFRVRPIGVVGPAPQDLDVSLYHPAGLQRWVLGSNSPSAGVLNMMQQVPDPGDDAQAPAQGAALTNTTAFGGADAWEAAARTEIFVAGNQGPAFVITNRGSVATSAGALAIECSLIRYLALPVDPTGGREAAFLGKTVIVPPGVDISTCIKLPIGGSSR